MLLVRQRPVATLREQESALDVEPAFAKAQQGRPDQARNGKTCSYWTTSLANQWPFTERFKSRLQRVIESPFCSMTSDFTRVSQYVLGECSRMLVACKKSK
eukprot:scpid109088/ scgid23430/ 